MMYHILLGGFAGDGIETTAKLLERILKNSGFYVFTIRDVMSRVRGGHNFVQIRFGREPICSHMDELDGIFATNEETCQLHVKDLKQDGFIITDDSLSFEDKRMMALPLRETAKALGNGKAAGSVAIGSILALFGIDISGADQVMEANLKESLVPVNVAAMAKGYTLVKPRYSLEPQDLSGQILISGTQASTLGAMAAGLKYYSAYPMSPSTGILEYLAVHGQEAGIAVEQAEDEIAAINMAIGAAYAGAPAMAGTSGGGLCLMVEALGFAGIAEIPIVIENVQRPGPATGLPTRTEQADLNFVIHASQGEYPRMVIALRNHTDAFYQTARAFSMAKKYQIPVIVLSDQYLGDSTAVVPSYDLDRLDRYKDECNRTEEDIENGHQKDSELIAGSLFKTYGLTGDGITRKPFPGKTRHLIHVDSDEHDEYGYITESHTVRKQMVDKRMNKMTLLQTELLEPELIGSEDCEILFVAFGSVYGPLKEAIAILNQRESRYAALVFGDVFPLPTKRLEQMALKCRTIISVEQNATAQLALLIRGTTSISCSRSILKYDGRQMTPDEIIRGLMDQQGGHN